MQAQQLLLDSSLLPWPRETFSNIVDEIDKVEVGQTKNLDTTNGVDKDTGSSHDDDDSNDCPLPPILIPPCSTDANFVNVYMLINPTKETVIMPEQILTYTNGSLTSRAIVGPTVIDLNQMGQRVIDKKTTPPSNDDCCSSTLHVLPPPTPNKLPDSTLMKPTTSSSTVALLEPQSSCVPSCNNTKLPLLPISPYNFFFKDERERILNNTSEEEHHDWSETKQHELLNHHWGRDRSQKRRHRKTHGRIGFKELSQLIASRWQALAEDQKDFYRQVALKDLERHHCEKIG